MQQNYVLVIGLFSIKRVTPVLVLTCLVIGVSRLPSFLQVCCSSAFLPCVLFCCAGCVFISLSSVFVMSLTARRLLPCRSLTARSAYHVPSQEEDRKVKKGNMNTLGASLPYYQTRLVPSCISSRCFQCILHEQHNGNLKTAQDTPCIPGVSTKPLRPGCASARKITRLPLEHVPVKNCTTLTSSQEVPSLSHLLTVTRHLPNSKLLP